jgi:beta-glucosidase
MKLRTKTSYSQEATKRELHNRQIAYRAALEGIVLLQNDGALPIKPGSLALYGAGAAMTIKGGTGSGEVNERYSVNIMEGMKKSGFTITTKKWIEDYESMYKDSKAKYADEFRKKIRRFNMAEIMGHPFRYPFGREITDEDISSSNTDTCIYVVSRQAGEGMDRKLDNYDNNLSEVEIKNIRKCVENYKKTIVVINVGSSFDVSFMDEIKGINALVFFCQQGTEGGTAFADIITGKVSPSGRLSDTWAMKYDDIPFASEFSYLNGNLNEEYYKEGIYVGYRYFDTFMVKPRYEFGYGLSYTEFSITVSETIVDRTKIRVKAHVTNTGKIYGGKEVVQLYVSCPQGKIPKEYQKLAAFAKTVELKPGQSEELELTFDLSDLVSYREDSADYILEKGDYILRIGESSRKTIPCAVVNLDEDVIASKHQNICSVKEKIQELTSSEALFSDNLENVERLSVKASDFTTVVYEYSTPPVYSDEKVDDLINKLSLKDMVNLVVGAGMFGNKNYFTAPGAVGNTTSKLVDKGIINVTFSDGPAGLRLQRTSAVTKRGKVKMIDSLIEVLEYMPKIIRFFVFGNPEKDTLIYQYTTAFPVGLSLAQTWNIELLEEVGQAISAEMKEYGITYWLAPAMNIHRNPLCGRNFEYFSEDPLLTGKLAAYITKGVQSVEGNYATIKHFCANNQEENRNKVSSNVSERALREIYLRGFEIAVREGGAKSVMTSYNRVNGIYTPNSYDLCTKALRNEWGFDGVVMTDWFSCGKGLGDSALALSAGNDLIMPGTGVNKKVILSAVKKGTIKEEDIKRCAANVLRSIVYSNLAKEIKVE